MFWEVSEIQVNDGWAGYKHESSETNHAKIS